MRPDAAQHNPDPAYLRQLLRKSGQSQAEAAAAIGLKLRTLEDYLSGRSKAPYPVQYALERLAMTPAERDDARAEDEAFAEVERRQKPTGAVEDG